MNLIRPALCAALLCGVASALAQQDPATRPGPPPHRQGPPPTPLFDALDTNHDGILSAEEIANAATSLKTLLKNGSDHLTRDDLRPVGAPPPPPPAADGPGHPETDENTQPRPKVGAIKPHGPPHLGEEDVAAPPGGPRMHPPAPEDARGADADPERPRREGMRAARRSHPLPDGEMDDTPVQHERMTRHEGPSRPEDADRMDADERRPRPEFAREDREGGHAPRPDNAGPRPHHGPPPSPLFDALDANHDGVLSADEIANSPAVLKGLLKNGSDHLTRDDLRPAADAPPQKAP